MLLTSHDAQDSPQQQRTGSTTQLGKPSLRGCWPKLEQGYKLIQDANEFMSLKLSLKYMIVSFYVFSLLCHTGIQSKHHMVNCMYSLLGLKAAETYIPSLTNQLKLTSAVGGNYS